MKHIKDNNYITIPAIFRTQYNLNCNEMMIASIIYGFSQDGKSSFTGSLAYLQEWTSLTKQGILKILSKLVNMGIIEKEVSIINGVRHCAYKTIIGGGKLSLIGVNSVEQGGKLSLIGGGKLSLPNNINIENKDNNKLTNVSKTPTKKPVLDYSFIEDAYKDVFRTWLIYKRDTFKETYKTQQSLQAAYNRLKKLSGNNPAMAREIVEQSMANNWKGLFELKTINNQIYGDNRANTEKEQRAREVAEAIRRRLAEDEAEQAGFLGAVQPR